MTISTNKDIKDMKLKLFICTFAIFLMASGFCAAGILGVQSIPELQNQEEEVIVDTKPFKYEQHPEAKQNTFASEKSVYDDVKKESVQENDATKGNALPDGENIKCRKDENGLLFCLNEKNKPYTGKRIMKNANGIYVSTENMRNGYLDGLCTYFDDRGTRKERTYYKRGIKNGAYKLYYSENNIKILANYREGLLNGVVDVYEIDNSLKGRMKYKNGYLEKGYCKNYDKKEEFSKEMIKSYPFNTLETCGVAL